MLGATALHSNPKIANSMPTDPSTQDEFCPTCGVQLYQRSQPRRKWIPLGRRRGKQQEENRQAKVPCNVEGKVSNGNCLNCQPSHGVTKGETMYVGDYNVYGQRHGPGELISENGDRYVGNFFNGLRDGDGTLYLNDGSEYAGEWELNRMHGTGTRTFCSGDVYTGQYVSGGRCGQGKLFFANGDLYSGSWERDQFHGFGRYFYKDGVALEGTFEDGKKQGKFKCQHPSGSLDIVRYDNDHLIGPGVRWNADRSKTWKLSPSGRNTSVNETMASPLERRKKRIPIIEAVSIGYDCETGRDPGVNSTSLVASLPLSDGQDEIETGRSGSGNSGHPFA